MNICVTGGAGYIGSVLTERLLSLNHKVTVVDTFLHGYHGIMRLAGNPLLTVVERDIRHEDLDYLNKQDVVFHLAAISNIKACEWDRGLAWDVNRNATAEISKRLHEDVLLIFASSTSIYGDRGGAKVSEEPIIYSTHCVYSQTKLDAERLIRRRENTIILRLATIYGVSPLMRSNAIVNDFVRMAVQDKRIVLYDGLTMRPYMHIEDCVDGLIFAMDNAEAMNGERYNLGCGSWMKSKLAHKIYLMKNYELVKSQMAYQYRQDFDADFSKIKALGFQCNHSMVDGIYKLIRLYSFYKP